ncbi:uncharacterized protein isoform X2 [Choristoneura fumiferana]
MVNELEIPDVTLSPYIFDPEPSISSSSLVTGTSTEECEFRSLSTDSSLPLSRAMTDSEIDYDHYKRYKRMNLTDPWDAMRNAMAAFPPEHLTSLSSLLSDSTDSQDLLYSPLARDEELLLRLERGFQDCCVFELEDPGLLELEEALQSLNLEKLYAEMDATPLQYYLGDNQVQPTKSTVSKKKACKYYKLNFKPKLIFTQNNLVFDHKHA